MITFGLRGDVCFGFGLDRFVNVDLGRVSFDYKYWIGF